MSEEKPKEIFQKSGSGLCTRYFDDGTIEEYDYDNKIDFGIRKMTEEEEKYLEKERIAFRKAFDNAYAMQARTAEFKRACKYKD